MIPLNQINLAGINAFTKVNLPIINTQVVAGMDNYKCFEVFTGLSLDNPQNLELFKHWEDVVIAEVLNLLDEKLAITQSIELVKHFHSLGITQAVVSNSNRTVIEKAVSCINIAQYISKIFSIEDVQSPKPHPEPYLNAMRHFGIHTHQTLVFEDSITGINSAKSANVAYVCGIGNETKHYLPDYVLSLDKPSWLDIANSLSINLF